MKKAISFVSLLLVFGALNVEGADLSVDLAGSSAQATIGSDISPVVAWASLLELNQGEVSLFTQGFAGTTSFPLDTNFEIRAFDVAAFYEGDPLPDLNWSLDMNDLDFLSLGVHSLSIEGKFTFDPESREVGWSMDSAPPLIFGPEGEYTLTILGLASAGDPSNPFIQGVLPFGDSSLVAYLSGSEVLVPEPETYLLLGSLLALGALARRRIAA